MRKLILLGFDLSIFAISPILALWLRDNFTLSWQKIVAILPYTLWGIAIAAICLVIAGTHRSIWRYASLADFGRLVATVSIAIMATLVLMFALNRLEGVARSIPIMQWFFIVPTMWFSRIAVRLIQRQRTNNKESPKKPLNKHDILIVGAGPLAELYLRSVDEIQSHALNVVGILDEFPALKGRYIHGRKVLGSPSELADILALLNIHGVEIKHIVITAPINTLSFQSIEVLFRLERNNTIELDMFEKRMGLSLYGTQDAKSMSQVKTESQISVEAEGLDGLTTHRFNYWWFKRYLDKIGAFSLAVIFSPLIALTCLLVALDVGSPLTFWQQRPGKNGRNFKLYKFRTMSDAHDFSGHRIPDEARSSRMGIFLRNSRLDELPQLYNIMIGEMSFVGPRPLLPIDQPFKLDERLKVRPGLTGWAQIHGGKVVSAEDKAVLDLWYIQNSSLWLDMKIVLKTVVMMIFGERFNLNAVRAAYQSLGIERQNKHFYNVSEVSGETSDEPALLETKQKIA